MWVKLVKSIHVRRGQFKLSTSTLGKVPPPPGNFKIYENILKSKGKIKFQDQIKSFILTSE